MRTLKTAILGYGVVGKRRHHFISQRDDIEVVAVSDKSIDPDATTLNSMRCYSDFAALLDQEKEALDAVFISLSNDVAAEATVKALNFGLHVFCEKPPARDLEELSNVLVTESKHPDLKLKYGFNHRYHRSIQDAKAIIDNQDLGKIISLRGVYGKSKMINFENDWRTQRQIAGGGILLDQGIHMVDLMRYFAGDFTGFKSIISNNFWDHDVEDNAYVMMWTDNKIVGLLHSTATEWRHSFSLEINMEKGALHLKGILSGSKSYAPEMLTIIEKAENGLEPLEKTIRYNDDPSWNDEIDDFISAIKSDRKITQGSSQDAFKTLETIYKIYCADEGWKNTHNLSDTIEGSVTNNTKKKCA